MDNEHGLSYHHTLYAKDIKDVYEERLKDSIDKYNKKQKRKDRFMTVEKYMKSVEEDTRGKRQTKKVNGKKVVDTDSRQGKQLSYEFTVKVGNCTRLKDENGRTIYDKNGHHIHPEELPRDLQKIILRRYASEFQKRNPNLALVRIDEHGDEGFYNRKGKWEYSEIHDHYEVVPFTISTQFKQGLSVQNSMNKAMSEMGFDNNKCYELWAKREQQRIAEITLEEYKKYYPQQELTIYHPIEEKQRLGDKTKEQYIEEQELDELAGELIAAKEKIISLVNWHTPEAKEKATVGQVVNYFIKTSKDIERRKKEALIITENAKQEANRIIQEANQNPVIKQVNIRYNAKIEELTNEVGVDTEAELIGCAKEGKELRDRGIDLEMLLGNDYN